MALMGPWCAQKFDCEAAQVEVQTKLTSDQTIFERTAAHCVLELFGLEKPSGAQKSGQWSKLCLIPGYSVLELFDQ